MLTSTQDTDTPPRRGEAWCVTKNLKNYFFACVVVPTPPTKNEKRARTRKKLKKTYSSHTKRTHTAKKKNLKCTTNTRATNALAAEEKKWGRK